MRELQSASAKNPNLMWFCPGSPAGGQAPRRADPVAQPSHQRSGSFHLFALIQVLASSGEIVALMVIDETPVDWNTCILIYSEWEKEMDSCSSPRRWEPPFLKFHQVPFRPHWPDLGHIPIPGPITVSEEPSFLS